jgi:predicted transcriptional regulator
MEKKMTKRDYYNEIIAIATEKERTDLVDFAKHEIELLDKKKGSADSKKTEEQRAVMNIILDTLKVSNEPMTVSMLMKANADLGALSNQKVSAMLKKLVDNGEVVKTVEKKVSYFSIA